MGKLTKAQIELLVEIAALDGGRTINDSYPPARKLEQLGLAELRKTKFGGCMISITPAGRAALSEAEGEDR